MAQRKCFLDSEAALAGHVCFHHNWLKRAMTHFKSQKSPNSILGISEQIQQFSSFCIWKVHSTSQFIFLVQYLISSLPQSWGNKSSILKKRKSMPKEREWFPPRVTLRESGRIGPSTRSHLSICSSLHPSMHPQPSLLPNPTDPVLQSDFVCLQCFSILRCMPITRASCWKCRIYISGFGVEHNILHF